MDTIAKFSTPGIALILTLAFGFWLSSTGRPYNGILFNVHKLIALGAVILTGIQIAKLLKTADSLALIITLLVVAAICVIALFATGAMMSIGTVAYNIVLTIHRIAPMVLVIALALTIWLLGRPA